MNTRVCFHDITEPRPGYEFYMVDVMFTNTGETRRDGYSQPQQTNLSREKRVEGWLGCTDNINLEAQGKFRIINVLTKKPAYWCQGYKVKIEKI